VALSSDFVEGTFIPFSESILRARKHHSQTHRGGRRDRLAPSPRYWHAPGARPKALSLGRVAFIRRGDEVFIPDNHGDCFRPIKKDPVYGCRIDSGGPGRILNSFYRIFGSCKTHFESRPGRQSVAPTGSPILAQSRRVSFGMGVDGNAPRSAAATPLPAAVGISDSEVSSLPCALPSG
jgi:hypothetical protein